MNIVFAAHSYFSDVFSVGSHRLATALADAGHDVLHISTPVGCGHLFRGSASDRERVRIAISRGREIRANLCEVVPFSWCPWPIARACFRCSCFNAYLLWQPSARGLVSAHFDGALDLLIIDEPRFAGLERILPASKVIYRATDLYAEMRGEPFLAECERRLLKIADHAVATSEPVRKHLQRLQPDKQVALLTNGVDYKVFSNACPLPEEYKNVDTPIVLYVGALDARFDTEAIRVAGELGYAVFIIGTGDRDVAAELRKLKNVRYLGPKPHREIAAYMQHAAVGFLPFNESSANQGRSPMKLYEFLAAGTAIVAKSTEELRSRRLESVVLYRTLEDLKECLSAAARIVPESVVQSRQSVAKGQDWSFIAEKLLLLCSADVQSVQTK
jgi:glycosyltransferase involved in cell wall biosynthesis